MQLGSLLSKGSTQENLLSFLKKRYENAKRKRKIMTVIFQLILTTKCILCIIKLKFQVAPYERPALSKGYLFPQGKCLFLFYFYNYTVSLQLMLHFIPFVGKYFPI
jgi:hypothetical protein